MKHNLFNRVCTTACLLAGMASVAPVLAVSTGTNFISSPNQMDIFKFSCPAQSLGAFVYISDLPFIGDPAVVGVTIVKEGVSQTADGTEDNITSQPAALDNGRGQYHLVYRMYGALTSSEDYTSDVFCRNAGALLIPPVSGSFRRILNQ